MKLSEVRKVCYKGYYYMVRQIETTFYLARPDTKLGWIVKKVGVTGIDKARKITKADWTIGGVEFPPFTSKDAEQLFSLKESKLDKLAELSKDQK